MRRTLRRSPYHVENRVELSSAPDGGTLVQIHDCRSLRPIGLVFVTSAAVIAGCSSAAPATPDESVAANPTPSESERAEPSPTEEPEDGGEPGVEGPGEVEAGAEFDVSWTGPDDQGDYIAIVPAGATEWTN